MKDMSLTTPTPDQPTTSPTKYRRTRIAVSVVFGVVTLLLVVLWVRSQTAVDYIYFNFQGYNWISAVGDGQIELVGDRVQKVPTGQVVWNTSRLYSDYRKYKVDFTWHAFYFDMNPSVIVSTPFWFVVALSTLATVLPFATIPGFSLRTMLISITLVAVVLGSLVWAAAGQ
jgi:hypothetical protein